MEFATHEATELYFHATSDRDCYERHLLPAYQNLERKWRKGSFDRELALKLLTKYTMISIAKSYWLEHCGFTRLSPSSGWSQLFPPLVRREVADHLLAELVNELELDNSYLPAKR